MGQLLQALRDGGGQVTTLERTDRVEPRAAAPAPEYVEVIVAVKDGDRIHTYMGSADEVTF